MDHARADRRHRRRHRPAPLRQRTRPRGDRNRSHNARQGRGGGPNFTVEMFDGSTVSLAELRGKVVLLNFWATWCPPCREELTHVQEEIIDRFAERPFVFLPVSRGESREAVAVFREETGYEFPMGLDSTAPSMTASPRTTSPQLPHRRQRQGRRGNRGVRRSGVRG